MKRHWHCPPIVIVVAAVGLAAAVFLQTSSSISPADDRDIMLGTWTDEGAEPGNSIRFYFVTRDLGAGPIKAYEGRATLNKLLGEVNAPAEWNYGSWNPLVLNISIGKRFGYIAIRKIDDDHILLRFGADAAEMYRPEAIDHPDTIRLTRTGREPRP